MPGIIEMASAVAWVWVRITSGIILRAGKRIGQARHEAVVPSAYANARANQAQTEPGGDALR